MRRLILLVTIPGVMVGLAFLSYVAFIGFQTVEPEADSYPDALAFDAGTWRDRSFDDDPMWPRRLRMADDLIKSRQLDGLKRDEVERLLGPPDRTEYFKNWDMAYWLGPERGPVRIDSEWLVLRLDPSGKVGEYKLMRD